MPLRQADALDAIKRYYPWLPLQETFADPNTDITLLDMYGGWKTDGNAKEFDAVSDSFAQYLTSLPYSTTASSG